MLYLVESVPDEVSPYDVVLPLCSSIVPIPSYMGLSGTEAASSSIVFIFLLLELLAIYPMDKVHGYYETSRQSIPQMGHATSCAIGPATGHATRYGHCMYSGQHCKKKNKKKKTIQVSLLISSAFWFVSKCPPPALVKLLLNYMLQVLTNKSSLLMSQRTLIHYYPRTRRQKEK